MDVKHQLNQTNKTLVKQNHYVCFILLSESNQIDILGVCETFLNKSIDDTLLHIDRFSFERKDRDTCNEIEANNGGGVMIYILDKIDYKRRFDLETPDVESI